MVAQYQPLNTCPIGATCMGNIKNILLGKNVSFGGNVLLCCNATIEIGENTMIGINTIIHTSTHDYNDHPMWTKRIDRPVRIGKDVWIGAAAIIMPGVIIEDYAVVGAGSVVNSNVPQGAIVAGNPAVIIKRRSVSVYEEGQSTMDPSKAIVVKKGFLNKHCKDKGK